MSCTSKFTIDTQRNFDTEYYNYSVSSVHSLMGESNIVHKYTKPDFCYTYDSIISCSQYLPRILDTEV